MALTAVWAVEEAAVPAVADAERRSLLWRARTWARPAALITEEHLTMARNLTHPTEEERHLILSAVQA